MIRSRNRSGQSRRRHQARPSAPVPVVAVPTAPPPSVSRRVGSRSIPELRATRINPPVQPPITEDTVVVGVRKRFTVVDQGKSGQWWQLPKVGDFLIGPADKTWYSFKSITFWAPPPGGPPALPAIRAIRFENNYQEMVFQAVAESDGSSRVGCNFPLWFRQKALTQSDATLPIQILGGTSPGSTLEVLLEYTARMVPANTGLTDPQLFDPDCPLSCAPVACEPSAPPAEVSKEPRRRWGPFTVVR